MILALQEGRCAIQLLQRIRRKPGNQLELMVAWQRAVFSLDVDEFLKQSKGVAQSLSVLLVAKQGVHHGLRDADEGGAQRSRQLSENGSGQRQPVCRDATASEKLLHYGLLFGSKILDEQPVDQKRFKQNAVSAKSGTAFCLNRRSEEHTSELQSR